MKTKPNCAGVIALLIAITATLTTQSIRAAGLDSIVFTENSDTSLTVIFDASTLPASDIQNTSEDHWTVTLPTSVSPDTLRPMYGWTEPENPAADFSDPTGWNTLTWISSTQLSIVSDTGLSSDSLPITNGNPLFGPDGTAYTFNDVSDGAVRTPDTGSTFGLLSLALAALVGASWLRSIRLA